jgi:hypothetical protein
MYKIRALIRFCAFPIKATAECEGNTLTVVELKCISVRATDLVIATTPEAYMIIEGLDVGRAKNKVDSAVDHAINPSVKETCDRIP